MWYTQSQASLLPPHIYHASFHTSFLLNSYHNSGWIVNPRCRQHSAATAARLFTMCASVRCAHQDGAGSPGLPTAAEPADCVEAVCTLLVATSPIVATPHILCVGVSPPREFATRRHCERELPALGRFSTKVRQVHLGSVPSLLLSPARAGVHRCARSLRTSWSVARRDELLLPLARYAHSCRPVRLSMRSVT